MHSLNTVSFDCKQVSVLGKPRLPIVTGQLIISNSGNTHVLIPWMIKGKSLKNYGPSNFQYFTERSIQAVPLENFVTDSDVNTCSSSETRQQTFIMYRKFTTFDHFIANVTLNTMKTTCDRVGYDFVYKDEQYLAGDCSQARMCTVAGEYSLKDRLTCAVKCPCKTQRCHFILHRSTAASLINLCEVNVSF